MADVTYTHPDYDESYPMWEMVEDAASGEAEVKAAADKYLPRPNPTDRSAQNTARYSQYLARAVYYNATGRTLRGLIGASFGSVPTLTVPPVLQYVADDIDGQGISIYQQSQAVLSDVLQKGRACLLVDYPRTDETPSVADMQSGRIRATAVFYEAEHVTNWRTEKVGANHVLSLVVIKESASEIDGFEEKSIPQYRVLSLIDGIYAVEFYRLNTEINEWVLFDGPYFPTGGNGQPLTYIPFIFVGSVANATTCDPSALADIASINLAHYRNSADYEDSVYMTGQPQAWISGLSEEWRNWMQEQGVYVGSRSAILLPEGGAFGIEQAQPNQLAMEAMKAKEEQMRSLGARLITPGSAVKTATQAQADNESDHSVLSLAVANVSEAYTTCLKWMAMFMRGPETGEYEIHVTANRFEVDPQLLGALTAANQAGKLPDSQLFRLLRKLDVIDPELTDEQIIDELQTTAGPALTFGNANG